MDSQLLGIITLLRSALNNEALSLPEDFDLSAAGNILYEHQLVGLAVRGAARCGVPRSHPEIRRLTALFCKDVSASRLQMQQLQTVFALFEEKGIEYLPVKGALIKGLYPQPELRAMGDADVLIREAQLEEAQKILSSLGMERIKSESDHEDVWSNTNLKIELHKYLIPAYNKDYYAYYGDSWKLARKDAQGCAWHLAPEDHFIYLLVHFAKHYRNGSISGKNICDFWVFRKAYPDMDESYICAELEKLQLLGFYRNILDLLEAWFQGAAPTEAVELITQTTLQGGDYSKEESILTAALIRNMKEDESFADSRRRWFWEKVFPPLSVMVFPYPILKKYPVLLPFMWVRRCIELVFFQPKRLKSAIISSKKMVQTDSDRVSAYEKQLKTVGLDFNFPE